MVKYPKDWHIVSLGDYCIITSSKRVFEKEWTKSGIPFLRTRDIASFHAGEEQKDKLFISESTYKEKSSVSGEPQQGDLLVTGVGTIGLPFLIDTDDRVYFKDGNILWIKRSESFYPKWLFLMFLSKDIKEQIAESSGFTTVGTFTIKNAKKMQLPMPEKTEQKTIAETLTVFDTHIANLTELIEKKKAIREGALEDLISGKNRLDGFEDKWETCSLEAMCYLITKQTGFDYTETIKDSLVLSKKGDVIPFIQNKDFEGTSVNLHTDYYIPKSVALSFPQILLDEKCLLISISGKIGNVGVYDNPELAFIGGAICIARLKDKDYTEWVMRFLQSSIGQYELTKSEKTSSHHNLTIKDVRKVIIPIPSKPEAYAINSILADMDTEIASLEEERDKMIKIREGAMDDLLTGKVRLTD